MLEDFWDDVTEKEIHPLILEKRENRTNKKYPFYSKIVENLKIKKKPKNIFKSQVLNSIINKHNEYIQKNLNKISNNKTVTPTKEIKSKSKNKSTNKRTEFRKRQNCKLINLFNLNNQIKYTFKPCIHKCPKFKPMKFNPSSNFAVYIYNQRLESSRREKRFKSRIIPFIDVNYDEIYNNISERCICLKKKREEKKKNYQENQTKRHCSGNEFSRKKDSLHISLMNFEFSEN